MEVILIFIVGAVITLALLENERRKKCACITVLGAHKLYIIPNTYLLYDTPLQTSEAEIDAYRRFKATTPAKQQQMFRVKPRKVKGYRFAGWYLDMDLTIPLPHVVLVEEAFTVYPKYVKI